MTSQPIPSEALAVLTAQGIRLPQTEKPRAPSQTQQSLEKWLKAELSVFGTIQILCGVVVLSLGIILAAAPASPYFTTVFSTLIKSAYPFAGSLCFIVSGSLSIITEKKSTKPLVHSSLACSILSTVLAVLGVALLSYTLAALDSAFQECELSRMSRPTTQSYFYFHRESYSTDCFVAKASVMIVLFQSYSHKNNPSIFSKTHGDSGYEELVTS
ncbi:membrane-spanning 4-domains subfamily A member 6A isoform X2 [Heterocephalus glaber]|uniref:Membrane-spanning 4-domains subfamily A member 6A isoform X2 n=1 Tax=Heterocephalus glaber TaxID=10181 RepID=A0AAX6QBY3_HETGA|nr:membrane-spanning 4-domains subfamily A member 6A isoform X2 [Heterocephalus glaber]